MPTEAENRMQIIRCIAAGACLVVKAFANPIETTFRLRPVMLEVNSWLLLCTNLAILFYASDFGLVTVRTINEYVAGEPFHSGFQVLSTHLFLYLAVSMGYEIGGRTGPAGGGVPSIVRLSKVDIANWFAVVATEFYTASVELHADAAANAAANAIANAHAAANANGVGVGVGDGRIVPSVYNGTGIVVRAIPGTVTMLMLAYIVYNVATNRWVHAEDVVGFW